VAASVIATVTGAASAANQTRPNILFAIADDWSWPDAGAYGDPVVKTPAFDRLAREGLLFHHAYVSSPSCTASRGAILTGQYHWRLEGAANLWSVFPNKFRTYPEILADAGYAVGVSGKGWGPGRTEDRKRDPAGTRYRSFSEFLTRRAKDKPFCYWLGSSDPHRPYKPGSGAASGMQLEDIRMPECFPDTPVVRSDMADYLFEVQRFDALVDSALKALEKLGELDNTIVCVTGDNGLPFPRCKANLYDTGVRVPLVIRWPARVPAGRTTDDFVSLTDLAPTFLEAAGLNPAGDMTGRGLMQLLVSSRSGRIDPERSFVLTGKERHCPAQEKPDMGGYPCRMLRTHDFLYIRNFRPDRWPAGTPNYQNATYPGAWFAECDNSPTKSYIVDNREQDALHEKLYDLSFAKRPTEELYDLQADPGQLSNMADAPEFAEAKQRLANALLERLRATGDPRALGGGDQFDTYPYLGGAPAHPDFKRTKAP
jgi:arylsulfatase A-like enzyme